MKSCGRAGHAAYTPRRVRRGRHRPDRACCDRRAARDAGRRRTSTGACARADRRGSSRRRDARGVRGAQQARDLARVDLARARGDAPRALRLRSKRGEAALPHGRPVVARPRLCVRVSRPPRRARRDGGPRVGARSARPARDRAGALRGPAGHARCTPRPARALGPPRGKRARARDPRSARPHGGRRDPQAHGRTPPPRDRAHGPHGGGHALRAPRGDHSGAGPRPRAPLARVVPQVAEKPGLSRRGARPLDTCGSASRGPEQGRHALARGLHRLRGLPRLGRGPTDGPRDPHRLHRQHVARALRRPVEHHRPRRLPRQRDGRRAHRHRRLPRPHRCVGDARVGLHAERGRGGEEAVGPLGRRRRRRARKRLFRHEAGALEVHMAPRCAPARAAADPRACPRGRRPAACRRGNTLHRTCEACVRRRRAHLRHRGARQGGEPQGGGLGARAASERQRGGWRIQGRRIQGRRCKGRRCKGRR